MWRSLVAHFVRDEGVGGSNPLIPTIHNLLSNNTPAHEYRGLSIYMDGAIGDDCPSPLLT
jgi:hypothetical protein